MWQPRPEASAWPACRRQAGGQALPGRGEVGHNFFSSVTPLHLNFFSSVMPLQFGIVLRLNGLQENGKEDQASRPIETGGPGRVAGSCSQTGGRAWGAGLRSGRLGPAKARSGPGVAGWGRQVRARRGGRGRRHCRLGCLSVDASRVNDFFFLRNGVPLKCSFAYTIKRTLPYF